MHVKPYVDKERFQHLSREQAIEKLVELTVRYRALAEQHAELKEKFLDYRMTYGDPWN